MANIELIRGLHIVTDTKAIAEAPIPRDLVEAVELSLGGGAVLVQYRDRNASTRERIAVGRRLREVTGRHGAFYLANADVEAAIETGADGIHIRWSDGDAGEIRGRIGPRKILGITIDGENLGQIREAEAVGADYIGVTIYPSLKTKPEAVPVGIKGLKRIRDATDLPIVAIGGIHKGNIVEVFDAGAHAAAVVGAALRTVNPKYATRVLAARANLVGAGR